MAAVLFIAAFAVTSSAAPASSVTFDVARDVAEHASPDVEIAQKKLDLSAAEVGVAGTWSNPSLNIQTARYTARLGTSISVPLPVFGQSSKASDAADAERIVAGWAVGVATIDARWGASMAWIDLWEAEATARLVLDSERDAETILAVAQERSDAGSGPLVDVVRARADRARAKAEAISAASAIRSASARLSPWLGATDAMDIATRGTPSYPATLPGLPQLEGALDDHAIAHRDRADVDAAIAHLAHERRQRWPIVNAQLGVDAFDPGLDGPDVIGGVSFEVPLFNLRGAAIARQEAQIAVTEASSRADRRRLRSALRDAYRKAEGESARVRVLESELVPAIVEARAMTEEAYRAGRVDMLRLLDAQKALIDARRAALDASASFYRATADLERALGQRWESSRAQ